MKQLEGYLIYDETSTLHEIHPDERVVVLAETFGCAKNVMERLGLPPYARQFLVTPSPRALIGGKWDVIIRTACAYKNRNAAEIGNTMRVAALRRPQRTILVNCR